MAVLQGVPIDNDFPGVLDIYADPVDVHKLWREEMDKMYAQVRRRHRDSFVSIDVLLPEPDYHVHYSFAFWHGEILDFLVVKSKEKQHFSPARRVVKGLRCIRNWFIRLSMGPDVSNPFLLFNNAVVKKTYSYCKELARENKSVPVVSLVLDEEFEDTASIHNS